MEQQMSVFHLHDSTTIPHATSPDVESSWPGAPGAELFLAKATLRGSHPAVSSSPGTEPVEGIFDDAKDPLNNPGIGAEAVGGNDRPGGESAAVFVDLALKQHTEPWYCEEFAKHPALYEFAIGVHYDQIFLRYSEPTSVTAWVPMGDVSLQGGGLIYMEDGHNVGQQIENEFTEKVKANGLTEEEAKYAFNRNMMSARFLAEGPAGFGREHGAKWLLNDFKAGDAVLHHPHFIHASTIKHDPQNRIRVGTDLRFVNWARPYDTVA
ncbi:uncharacterized protein IWZ02DRAFT_493559 [Phyllosticta citriasiana]|uniref:uncharacterized protein n=1 Tax=Phyllosticta citriasiana TaxID=595635 RepID=UPI0030FDAB5D